MNRQLLQSWLLRLVGLVEILAFGAVVALFAGQEILDWYLARIG